MVNVYSGVLCSSQKPTGCVHSNKEGSFGRESSKSNEGYGITLRKSNEGYGITFRKLNGGYGITH